DVTVLNSALTLRSSDLEDLEAQSNPHEGAASEQRIRRLAFLKRDRRAAVDRENRRDTTREKLESCLLALRNLRLDLSRMEVGSRSYQQVTTLVEHAQQIANDLDGILSAEREVSSRTLRPSAQTAPRA